VHYGVFGVRMQNNELINIYKEFTANKKKIEMSTEQMLEDISSYINKIVLYGAGSAGIAFLYYLRSVGIEPICFADGDSQKWGTICEGIEIIDYSLITSKVGSEALVIVTINTDGEKYCKSFAEELRVGGHRGVHQKLHNVGCKNVIDYTFFRRTWGLFRGDRYNLPSCSDVYLMEEHFDDIVNVFEMLDDDISKKVYSDIVFFRMVDDTIKIRTEPQTNQYFEKEFYRPREDAVFIDCGAYNGISLNTFLKKNGTKYNTYYGIEPDTYNFELLEKCVSDKTVSEGEIQLINAAAYNKNGTENLYQLCGPGSFISDIGKKKVQTITIDSIINEDIPTFIKMNIEGSEHKALLGAKKTISNYHPQLAIAGYHKTKDLWEIPALIKTFDKDYKIKLRSYMNHISFVFYATK